ncbi:MAG: hypothetical protein KF835_02960 [Xanthobacteraceae bacterium]|nr:hypothetical protein [Xanthobacteraceae bacterium]
MRLLAVIIFLFATVTGAFAQVPKNREEYMQKILQIALDNLHNARCEKGERCAPATEAEKKNPPLTLAETSKIVGRGIFSGGAAYCGMNWQKRNFEPMMAYWRNEKKKNARQLALIEIIHGIMIEQITANFSTKGPCPDEIKKDLESKLDFKP